MLRPETSHFTEPFCGPAFVVAGVCFHQICAATWTDEHQENACRRAGFHSQPGGSSLELGRPRCQTSFTHSLASTPAAMRALRPRRQLRCTHSFAGRVLQATGSKWREVVSGLLLLCPFFCFKRGKNMREGKKEHAKR
ncbi:hypothetical protein PAHAL_3G159000 [Panicum hallii]|uniref:Uncharacterized protein n=1 Tax=Panicum hallii TaxID=206008 RepID=A0A2S3H947_9POAL|nr:hypothetical protein PAHAL_3G159000 [Panicum hallii]